MRKIFVQQSSPVFAHNKIFETLDLNRLNAGWIEMKKQFAELGYDLMSADDHSLSDCEGIIFFNADSLVFPMPLSKRLSRRLYKLLGRNVATPYPSRPLYDEALAAGLRERMVLVLWEPRTVLASNFDPKIWKMFDHILTWDDDLIGTPPFERFVIPMEGNDVRAEPMPFEEKKLLVNISINKYSSYKNERYSARRTTSAYFDKHYPRDFDLYGLRWNKPVTFLQKLFPFLVQHYSTYRGHAGNKLDILARYKFNLCYENTSDAKGYVCDKIFTSFHARSVPVYWGASNIEEYIDPDAFVDRRAFASDRELAEFLVSVTKERYQQYLDAAERYMQSEKYATFLPKNFARAFIRTLKLEPTQ
ncbi:MAG TPA: glycosyltransferase family 10 [Candidatus Paceibacterota bacterium]|nr:glycosyltransferase family 10 [Candidatus Paceibacterota bacterium]